MSDQPKFTPGPWIYVPDNKDYGSQSPYMVWTSRGPGYGTVASTCSAGLMPNDPERQAADARLISAAPDLYERLSALLSAVKRGEVLDHHVRSADAAIAKADGRPIEQESSIDPNQPIILYTSAPENHDGFGTKTLAIVGKDTINHLPVRKIEIQAEHYDWQTTRYGSGSHRYTHSRCGLDDYARFGDWVLDQEEPSHE